MADLLGGNGLVLGRTKLIYTHVYRTEEFYGQKGGQLLGSVSLAEKF